jgi:hypothetical protein
LESTSLTEVLLICSAVPKSYRKKLNPKEGSFFQSVEGVWAKVTVTRAIIKKDKKILFIKRFLELMRGNNAQMYNYRSIVESQSYLI